MPTLRTVAVLLLIVLGLAGPAAARDFSTIPDAPPLPPGSPVASPDTPNAPPNVCFAYNPNALTNACLTYNPRSVAASDVAVTPGAGTCIVGDQCAPAVTVFDASHKIPMYQVSIEATRACVFASQACRVEN